LRCLLTLRIKKHMVPTRAVVLESGLCLESGLSLAESCHVGLGIVLVSAIENEN